MEDENGVKLGPGQSPDAVYWFVGETKDERGNLYPWYTFDNQAKAQVPVPYPALTGKVTGLRMKLQRFKDKDNVKLDVQVMADRQYVIRTGVDTTFARGLLLALELVDDYAAPLTLVAANSDQGEKVVFSRLYRAKTNERVQIVWDRDRKLFPLVTKLQQRMGQKPQTWADVQATLQQAPPPQNGHSQHDEDGPPYSEPEFVDDDTEDCPF